jgi:hypothetical protein
VLRQAARLLRFSFQAFPGELTVAPRWRTGNAPGLKRKWLTTVALQSSGRVSEPFFGASLRGMPKRSGARGRPAAHRGREGPGAARDSVSESADLGRSCCKTAQSRGTLAWSSPCSADRPVSGAVELPAVEGIPRLVLWCSGTSERA